MIHSIEKHPSKPMWNVITLAGIEGGVYWMGQVKGSAARPYNLVFRKKDEGMFASIAEISGFINSI